MIFLVVSEGITSTECLATLLAYMSLLQVDGVDVAFEFRGPGLRDKPALLEGAAKRAVLSVDSLYGKGSVLQGSELWV